MLRNIRRRFKIWRYRNHLVAWKARSDYRVPGMDCPWEAGDKFELHSPRGKVCGSGEIDAEFANDMNKGLHWN